MSIITLLEKISNLFKASKNFIKDLLDSNFFKGILVLFAVTISFLLGRLSSLLDEAPVFTLEEGTPDFVDAGTLQKTSNFDFVNAYKNTSTSTIVASRNGKKYYFVWCKSAGSLKEENKIYFKTEEEAQKTGRTLGSGCK